MKGERGLTIVEVLIAGLVLIAGALGVATLVSASAHTTFRAEQSQMVANLLQRELEQLRRLPYDELAMESPPVAAVSAVNPNYRVVGGEFYVGREHTDPQPLVEDTVHGKVDPESELSLESTGGIGAKVNRYVVWDSCPRSLCEGGRYLKRVIVAVSLDPTAAGGVRRYQEIQGQVVDPSAEPAKNPGPPPGGEEDDKPWTVWLTDTTCDHESRQQLTGNHPSHNTLGVCATDAPDLMEESAPPDEPEKPLYDYATDVEPTTEADKDTGLTLRTSSGGCNAVSSLWGQLPLVPSLLDPTLYQKVHKWLSPPMPGGIDLKLEGRGTLSLWTKTIGPEPYGGKICAAVFTRQLSVGLLGSPIFVDTPAINLDLTDGPLSLNYFSYELTQWPSSGWTEVDVPLHFTLNTDLLPNWRLGVALWVAGSGTDGDGLQFMYDARSFDSRLELKVANTVSLPIFGG